MKLDLTIICSILILVLTFCVIFVYGRFRCKCTNFKDPLTKKVIINDITIDGWHILHIFFYFMMTAILPQYFYVWFLVGLIWELFEYYAERLYLKSLHCDDKLYPGKEKWWKGRFSDILYNYIGITTAYILFHE